MRALISGGTGFVGAHLTSLLLDHDREVFVFGQRESAGRLPPHPRGRYFQGDIRDRETVAKLVRDVRPDEIFHLAAITFPPAAARDPSLTFEVNVGGTMNLLEAAAASVPQVRLLNVSSGQVYGRTPQAGGWAEDAPLSPAGPYASSKAMAEQLARQHVAARRAHIVTARPFNHIGPGQSPDFVLASFAQQFARIEAGLAPAVLKVGNLDVERDFTDVRDVVRAYRLLLECGRAGGVYNVCSGKARSLSEVVAILQQLSSKTVAIEVEPSRQRSDDVRVVLGSPALLRTETGWSPAIPLETSLRDLLDYWRAEVQRSVPSNAG